MHSQRFIEPRQWYCQACSASWQASLDSCTSLATSQSTLAFPLLCASIEVIESFNIVGNGKHVKDGPVGTSQRTVEDILSVVVHQTIHKG